jgi:hypothetical protein
MKNIHLLPTDKPSRLRYNLSNVLVVTKELYRDYGKEVNQNIYITSDEAIKEGDWVLYTKGIKIHYIKITNSGDKELANIKDSGVFKIILTTDTDLIEDDVQDIDNEFLEWFVKNPSCEEVEIADLWKDGNPSTHDMYQIIIPQEETKQEKLEEAADKFASQTKPENSFEEGLYVGKALGFIEGAKWQAERMYSDIELFTEELKDKIDSFEYSVNQNSYISDYIKEWFEQFKKK